MSRPDFYTSTQLVTWLILNYFDSQPDARDTAEGIAQWWLCGEEIDVNLNTVRDSLASLVRWGWLTETRGQVGLTRYGLNKTRQGALRQFLQSQARYR